MDNKITIGAAIIAKNEEVLLPRLMESLKGLDEIVIVDTGSSDKTIEVAKKYTDKVFDDFKWNDDFADARNHVRKKMSTDWILSIDADEILHDVSKVREAVALAEQRGALAISVQLRAEDNGQKTVFPRLYKRSDQVWWEGAIHNHLSIVGEDIGSVKITYGYSPAHLLDPNRTLRILEREVKERPDAVRELFYLGREYYYRKDYEKALKTFGTYVQRTRFLAEKAEAFLEMSIIYWNMGMGDDARDACAQALIINSNFKEAAEHMAKISGKGSGNKRWEDNAKQWERMAETANNENVLFVRDGNQ